MATVSAVHDDLVAVVRDFTAHELLPRAEVLDAADPDVIVDVWRRVVDLDLDRALLAEKHGGVGLDVDDFLCVLEEVAAGDAGVALTVLLNNAAVVSLPSEAAAALPHGARWTLALGADDPIGGGVRFAADGVVAGRLGGVFGAVGADGIVVATRAPQPTVFAVPTESTGLTLQPDPQQLGLRAARLADLVFAGVAVSIPLGAELAEARARSLVRCGMAAISSGIARRAHDIALTYAHTRIQGGVPIVEHEAVADMLADMTVRLATGAADRLAAATDDPAAALAHKIVATDAAMATTLDAVQVMGGIGYMVDTGVEKLMRDAKYCQLFPERNWLGRAELMRGERSSG